MFENMSDREKKLSLLVGSVLPILLVVMVFFWFSERVDSNDSEISGLETKIKAEEVKTVLAKRAAKRNLYYRKASLPVSKRYVRSDYKNWLAALVKDSGMEDKAPNFKEGGKISHGRETVALRNVITIRPIGTLEQLVKFLHGFYSADQLHRINSLSIKPDVGKKVRGKAPVLTGRLILDIDIETLSLVDGPENIENFPAWKNELPAVDEYTKQILARNIFGPANNQPTFDKPKPFEFYIAKEGEDVTDKFETIQLSAVDADKDDLLKYAIVEQSGVESNVGVILGDQPRTASQRRISLKVPKQTEPVRIPISMRVTDDGLPAKEDLIEFSVVFKKPKPKESSKPKSKPKPINFAKVTYVNGLNRSNDKKWIVVLFDQMSGEIHQLGVDETIKIGEVTWKVVEIDSDSDTVTFEFDGKRESFKNGENLATPMTAL